MRLLSTLAALVALSGCTTYGTVINQPLTQTMDVREHYSLQNKVMSDGLGEITVVVAMSGGGTRAAALSYGVLKGLRDLTLSVDGVERSLLDEVDIISSVSGGSFTAAYYGLHGDKLFSDFEQDFLYFDFGQVLMLRMMTPGHWLSSEGRTDEAVEYYEDRLFNGSTYADLNRAGGPLIVINATDLARGMRFSFTQEYFSLLCSDISSYPVASAVAASSAVPVLFNPIVLQNYAECHEQMLFSFDDHDRYDDVDHAVIKDLQSYANKSERGFVHLVDGGVTDNLGLLAIHDIINYSKRDRISHLRSNLSTQIIVISIDASTRPSSEMENSTKEPSLSETISFMTDVQTHQINAVTKSRFKHDLQSFTQKKGKDLYFIDVNLWSESKPDLKRFLNNIPTDFELEKKQVDALIEQGINQIKHNPMLKKALADFSAS